MSSGKITAQTELRSKLHPKRLQHIKTFKNIYQSSAYFRKLQSIFLLAQLQTDIRYSRILFCSVQCGFFANQSIQSNETRATCGIDHQFLSSLTSMSRPSSLNPFISTVHRIKEAYLLLFIKMLDYHLLLD